MPNYLARFDRGPSERFEAVSDAAARDYVRELLADGLADDGDAVSLYAVDAGGRGDEDFIGEIVAGDDGQGDDGQPAPCCWREGFPN